MSSNHSSPPLPPSAPTEAATAPAPQDPPAAAPVTTTPTTTRRPRRPERWWTIHPFRGMARDVRRRLPYYWSDWRDAWDYRVVPATVYMFFAK